MSKFLNEIVIGDCRDLIKQIDAQSVNLIITSPPYFRMRNYTGGDHREFGSETTVDEYVDNLFNLFEECVRVVRDDGSIVFNLGDKYMSSSLLLVPHRFAIRVLDESQARLVNHLTWVKMNPVWKPHKKRMVPSTEPFFHFVKTNNYYYDTSEFDKVETVSKRGNKVGQGYFEMIDKASELSDDQKEMAKEELRQAIIEVKEGKIASLRMKIRGMHSLPYGGQAGGRMSQLLKKGYTIIKMPGKKIQRDVLECPVESIPGGGHPAIYPETLVEKFVKLTTREGDVVFDPFVGSGTSLVVASRLNRKFIGFELNSDYVKLARRRLRDV